MSRFIEKLQTPHANRLDDTPPEQFLAVLDETIDAMRQSDTALSPHEQSLEIARLVHRSLYFRINRADSPQLTPDNLAIDQTTNCYGYTLVLSECLERADVRHSIGFINGHALTVIEDDSTPWFIDAQAPHLSGPITTATGGRAQLAAAFAEKNARGRSAIRFYSDNFLKSLPSDASPQELFEKYPWLSFRSSPLQPPSPGGANSAASPDHTLILGLYEMQAGRHMLETHAAFMHTLRNQQPREAYAQLATLHELYPQLDSRIGHPDVEKLIRQLGSLGLVDEAINSIAAVNEGTSVSHDARHMIWQADQLRKLGHTMQNISVLDCAVLAYNAALRVTKYPRLVEEKKAKAIRLRAQAMQQKEQEH